jgi:CRISPR-associated protein Csx3
MTEKDEYTIIHFALESNISPEILGKLEPPKVNGTKGVILSGRGPIWLYCYLFHYYHPTKFIATFDPRIGGAIIVESHSQDYRVGEVIKVKINELINQ